MSRRWRAMVCLLLCANAATAAGLAAEGAGSAPVPPQESCFEPGTTQRAGPAESRTSDIQVQGEPAECEPLVNPAPGAASPTLADFWGYRSRRHEMNWIVGDGDQFGDFSLRTNTYQPRGIHSGLDPGLEFHFLAGPERTDMPPRVFDFSIGYQKRDLLGNFAYDVAIAVRASSDFEGSAREGIRFPSHAVGYFTLDQGWDFVFGVDFLDRGDVKLLPVVGLIWRNPTVRLELIFPSPRLHVQLDDTRRLFLAGGLGGETWAVQRDSLEDDLAVYHDLRVSLGLETTGEDGGWGAIEIAYLFDRKLEFSSGNGDYRPNGTVMICSVHSY